MSDQVITKKAGSGFTIQVGGNTLSLRSAQAKRLMNQFHNLGVTPHRASRPGGAERPEADEIKTLRRLNAELLSRLGTLQKKYREERARNRQPGNAWESDEDDPPPPVWRAC